MVANRWQIWASGTLVVLLLLLGVQPRMSLFAAQAPAHPQCQPCIDSVNRTYQQCKKNACTSAGGHPKDQGVCDSPQNQGTLAKLIDQCTGQYNKNIKTCASACGN